MSPEEIKAVVQEVLAEQRILTANDVDHVAIATMATILKSFGLDEEERLEIKADFSHLRRWRKSVEQTQTYAFKTIVTVLVGGFLGMVWLGFKTMLGK